MRFAVVLLALVGCGAEPAGDAPTVPHTTGPVTIDGNWTERDWPKALRRQFFGNDGELSRPSSEIRLLCDEAYVYVGLYAADDDLESTTDAFNLVVGDVALRIGVTGQFAPSWPGVRVAANADGTMDDKKDHDEEWLLEAAIPHELIAHGPVIVAASRCDTPLRTTSVLCGAWWGAVNLP
jgi:hypothetical protein